VSTDFQGTNDSIQGKLFQKGFIAALRKDTTFFKGEEARNYFRNRQEAVILAAQEATRKAGEQFLNENKQKEGVKTTASGLQYKVLVAGNGPVPTQDDRVIVKYEGRLIDGTVFDSSYEREEQTNKFRPTEVIKGWTEALTMMPVGSKWELYIPQELAYGSRKTGSIPAYSALVFIVELVGIDQP
jgi:FKBP-type peptidyl-prolyl cis-trans isomerase FklB